MIEHLKLVIAKMKRERFGQSSERGGRVLEKEDIRACLALAFAAAEADHSVLVAADR